VCITSQKSLVACNDLQCSSNRRRLSLALLQAALSALFNVLHGTMDPTTAASIIANLQRQSATEYHNHHAANGLTSPLQSPHLNGNPKGRESPNGLPAGMTRSNGTTTPTSSQDAENGNTPKEERLIVGVDFGTTYSG
jgi:hypothetical protein